MRRQELETRIRHAMAPIFYRAGLEYGGATSFNAIIRSVAEQYYDYVTEQSDRLDALLESAQTFANRIVEQSQETESGTDYRKYFKLLVRQARDSCDVEYFCVPPAGYLET